MPGKAVILEKRFDPATGRLSLVSTDGQIRSSEDLVRLEEADREEFRSRYGRLSHALADSLESMAPGNRKRVVVALKYPEGITYLDKLGITPRRN